MSFMKKVQFEGITQGKQDSSKKWSKRARKIKPGHFSHPRGSPSGPARATSRAANLFNTELRHRAGLRATLSAPRVAPRVWTYKALLLAATQDKGIWYMDSGCSRHVTGNKSVLSDYHDEKGPSVTFGGNGKCQTRGFGTLSNGVSTFRRVAYVEGLKHNLASDNSVIKIIKSPFLKRIAKWRTKTRKSFSLELVYSMFMP